MAYLNYNTGIWDGPGTDTIIELKQCDFCHVNKPEETVKRDELTAMDICNDCLPKFQEQERINAIGN